jgi:hypothetical protein
MGDDTRTVATLKQLVNADDGSIYPGNMHVCRRKAIHVLYLYIGL